MLRRFKPEVVLGHDEQGEYGHGAHRLNTYCLEVAIKSSTDAQRDPGSYQQYGSWDVPKCYLHDYEKGSRLMDWDKPLDAFDGKTGYEMAQAAFLCHVSQQNGHHEMSKKGRLDCRKFGLYRSLVGDDVEMDDFFENTPLALSARASATLPLEETLTSTPTLTFPLQGGTTPASPSTGKYVWAWPVLITTALALPITIILSIRGKKKK